jgi:hypothetical protein
MRRSPDPALADSPPWIIICASEAAAIVAWCILCGAVPGDLPEGSSWLAALGAGHVFGDNQHTAVPAEIEIAY